MSRGMKTSHGWSRCIGICLVSGPDICIQKPGIYRWIRSSRDKLGFYAEIQILFGTVQGHKTRVF